ncbi:MFS transporter [Paenibacillus tengchongensis]|uniref:MFS transporter n=1 Tax=Paenibacillus tengchongensis TaxID=2608684 RepID=UPI00124D6605|nr:MFS transporter [Paenibacillus tengchongensis]
MKPTFKAFSAGSRYAWFLILYFWIYGFVGSVNRFVQSYYQEDISRQLSTGRSFLGTTWSLSIIIGAVCSPIGGYLIDKYSYKKVMMASSLLGAASVGTLLLFQNTAGYFIGFGVLSGLIGIAASANYIFVADWFSSHRAKVLVILNSSNSLGLAILSPIFILNESRLGWIQLYWVTFASGLLFCVFTFLVVRRNPANRLETELHSERPREKLKVRSAMSFVRNLQDRRIMVVMIALFTCGFSMGTVEMHLMAIYQVAGANQMIFSSSLSLLGVLELSGGIVFSFLLDRMRRELALGCLYIVRVTAFVILFLNFPVSPLFFSLIFGASYLGALPGGILLANETLEKKGIPAGMLTGFLICIHQAGGAISGIAGGANYDLFHNYQLLIGANILLSLLSSIGYLTVYRKSNVKVGAAA